MLSLPTGLHNEYQWQWSQNERQLAAPMGQNHSAPTHCLLFSCPLCFLLCNLVPIWELGEAGQGEVDGMNEMITCNRNQSPRGERYMPR